MLQAILLVVPKLWATGPSGEVAGHELATSKRALGKVPDMQMGPEPPALTDEELAFWL